MAVQGRLWLTRLGRLLRLLVAMDFAAVVRRWQGLSAAMPRRLPATLKPVTIARAKLNGTAAAYPEQASQDSRRRLLIVVPGLERDGAPLSACDLARLWHTSGAWQVTVASPRPGPVADDLARAGVSVEIDPIWLAPSWSPAAHLAAVAAIRDRILAEQPATILVMTIDMFAVIEAAAAAGVRTVWNIREGEPWTERLADRHQMVAAHALGCFAAADAVIFVSEATAQAWRGFCGSDTLVHVIRNAPKAPAGLRPACDRVQLRADLGLPQEGFVALCVGTLSKRKGQLDVIKAVQRLRQAGYGDVTGVLVGGNALPPAERAAWALQAGDAVLMPGEVAEPAAWYAAADVLVCASRAEGIPRVSHEAGLSGVPIITTPVGGIREVLAEGESALFFQPGDVEALAQLLLQIRGDRALADRLAAGARAAMVRCGSSAAMAQAYENILLPAAHVESGAVSGRGSAAMAG